MPITQYRSGRVIAAAAILPAMLFAVSSIATPARAADATTSSSASHQAAPSRDRLEERITDLHKKLHVTADQQGLWDDMAQVMRANAQKMRDNVTDRTANLKSMNAVDDLRSYQKITDEHADGLKRLIPTFEALYAKMSPEQQKNADHVFGEQQRHAVHQS